MVDETDGGSPRVGEGERAVEGGVCDGVVVEAEPVGSGGLVRGVEEEVGGGDAGGDVVGDPATARFEWCISCRFPRVPPSRGRSLRASGAAMVKLGRKKCGFCVHSYGEREE